MIVATLRYARDDEKMPDILEQQALIEEYGAAAVLGRTQLGAGEMRRMLTCRNLVRAIRNRARYEHAGKNAIEFELDNPTQAAQIERAEMIEEMLNANT